MKNAESEVNDYITAGLNPTSLEKYVTRAIFTGTKVEVNALTKTTIIAFFLIVPSPIKNAERPFVHQRPPVAGLTIYMAL